MSSWELYWILMLDNIRSFLIAVTVVGFIGSCVMPFVGVFCLAYADEKKPPSKEARRWGNWCLRVFTPILLSLVIVFGIALVFVPTTKQAAVIFVLPKIATEENIDKVQDEVGDLYGLTKEWLENQVKKGEPKR